MGTVQNTSISTGRVLAVALAAAVTLLSTGLGAGQPPEMPVSLEKLLEGVRLSEEIPLPESVLGHRVGDRHTRPDQIASYFEAVGRASSRVVVERHGTTYQGRPLVHAVVTSTENHQKLNQLRQENLALTETPGEVSDDRLARMPVVVMMGYGVHGNEASGGEAALLLLYYLAAGEGDKVDRLLRDCVVIINPMLNPDGRSRFVEWVNGNRGRVANSDPFDREHVEPWPGGRTNHYWFDLNRDWLPARLLESRARLTLYHQWKPQLVTDFHEMGSDSTFFFQPGVPSRDNPNTPQRTLELTRKIAAYHARILDRIGSLYYSEEDFDDFYYGKGSTYPDINGGVGILFEQASSRALKRETRNGLLEFGFTVRNQFAASLSSLEAAADLRLELLGLQREFYREALKQTETGVTAYLLDMEADGRRGRILVETLLRHQIRAFRLARSIRVEDREFRPESTLVIPVRQPQGRLLNVLFERVKDFNDSVFYDVSTWTLPLAYAVNAREFTGDPGPLLGARFEAFPEVPGTVSGLPPASFFALRWNDYRAPYALAALQGEGLRTRVMVRPFATRVDNELLRFDRGTVIVPAGGQTVSEADFKRILGEVAARTGCEFTALSSGLTEEGVDLGGPSSIPLAAPKVGLVVGRGVNSGQAGGAWFVLNELAGVPVSLIELDRLSRSEIGRYNVLILPSGAGSPDGEDAVRKVAAVLEAGGTVIAIQDAAAWLVRKEVLKETLKEWTVERKAPAYSEVAREKTAQTIPGSIFELSLDVTHPIAFGLPERLPIMRDHEVLIEKSSTPGANVGTYSDQPLLSGYVQAGKLPQLAGSAAVIARRLESGRVVLFLDDPNFRATWYGSMGLFFNAVFFGSVF